MDRLSAVVRKRQDVDPLDASAEEEAAATARREHDQLMADVREILASTAGNRFFQWFFRRGMLFSTTFTGNSHGYFLEGGRNLALQVFNVLVQAAPIESLTALLVELKTEAEETNNDGKRAE
jgi:hypothetical protein